MQEDRAEDIQNKLSNLKKQEKKRLQDIANLEKEIKKLGENLENASQVKLEKPDDIKDEIVRRGCNDTICCDGFLLTSSDRAQCWKRGASSSGGRAPRSPAGEHPSLVFGEERSDSGGIRVSPALSRRLIESHII